MHGGGARDRTRPKPSWDLGRAEQRGYSLRALPSEGYLGALPE